MKFIQQVSLILIAIALVLPVAHAKKKDHPSNQAAMDAHMKEVMKRGAPNQNHKIFLKLEGNWEAKAKFWMAPEQTEPEITIASVQNEIINNGRFLKQTYKGDWNGAPYHGTGFTGYDNIREEYENIWMDNFSTGMMKATGEYNTKSKTLNFSCKYSCAMTGDKNKWMRSEWTIKSKNKNIYKSYSKDSNGKEFLAMEITYKRAKN